MYKSPDDPGIFFRSERRINAGKSRRPKMILLSKTLQHHWFKPLYAVRS